MKYSNGAGFWRPEVKRDMCIKRLFWPAYEVKNKSCSSQVSSYLLIRTIVKG